MFKSTFSESTLMKLEVKGSGFLAGQRAGKKTRVETMTKISPNLLKTLIPFLSGHFLFESDGEIPLHPRSVNKFLALTKKSLDLTSLKDSC